MTAMRVAADDAAPVQHPALTEGDVLVRSPGALDPDETRHRLRRALRILLAARRRDDGGPGPTAT
jgi:hypothetical protein